LPRASGARRRSIGRQNPLAQGPVRCALNPLVKSFCNKGITAEAVAGPAFPRGSGVQTLKL